jgi:glycosyltransferase involved in cell wall biosynthesis
MKKIHILFKIKKGPWGGGNQFLRALREALIRRGAYAENPNESEVILFNSHHSIGQLLRLWITNSDKTFIHRVDGPLTRVRGGGIRNRITDRVIFALSRFVADATVFQSAWSKEKAKEFGYKEHPYDTIINNASDPSIFYDRGHVPFGSSGKIRLIATSWSANERKGFSIYRYLDENLDFSKFDVLFVGNTPCSYQNIKVQPPMKSNELADELRQSDIFITASQQDPCSNSLIEALTCGLPAVARNDGGHRELLQNGGVTFEGEEDVISAIETVVKDYETFKSHLPQHMIDEVATEYLEVALKAKK